MSKQAPATEKKESHTEGKPAQAQQPQHGGGEAKKPQGGSTRSKGHEALPGNCFAWTCKSKANRFNFCDEHYDHFKFGLIKKTGEQVPDFEKKFEHYQARHSSPKTARKVA